MESMPVLGWTFVALAVVASILWHMATRRRFLDLLAERERRLQELIERENNLSRDAARLPDALARASESEASLKQIQQELTNMTARDAALRAQHDSALLRVATLQQERDAVRLELSSEKETTIQLRTAHARASAERTAAMEACEGIKQFLGNAQDQLRTAFIAASSEVFDQKAAALDKKIQDSSETTKVGLEQALRPFAAQIVEFQAEARKLHDDSSTKVSTLTGSIQHLQTLNQSMADATESLARALKGNAKTRGDWGEMILDTVLKASGLTEGTNFVTQHANRDEESGQLRKPDVIVKLPDGKQVVVDSKVNLVAWADACNADTAEAYQEALVRHTAALRLHVRDLCERNYPKVLGPSALDMTILFVPIEGALAAALSINQDLQGEAFAKRVVFASPNTLMAMLRVVERLWTRDKLQKQVGKIGEEAGKLLDSLSAFVEEFQEIGDSINKTRDVFDIARNRFLDSPQSVTARARRLVEAGAKGKRPLHEELLPVLSVSELAAEPVDE